ncbi:Pre-mRNA splicing factor PRP21 like protein-domain-containing protein [Tuber brumale]|nr:Pre-mRNA splicing factor PRP21 like protein-domain-containing protein [Tuber brumale]
MSPGTPTPTQDTFVPLDQVNKPPEGVVLPPKDLRAIVEKTAGYVARNGQVFEQRIREKEKHNPKFSFLNSADPYYQFYIWRLEEIRAGRGTALAAGRAGPADNVPAEAEKPKGPKEPPEFRFSARMPNISAQDLDILRLTALFVAKNGRSFLTTLSQREARNFQFDFLRPNHSFYQYFSRLVDQYTDLLSPGGGVSVEELEKNVRNRFDLLDRSRGRAELAYAQIDWHDFVVVETVLFTDADDQAELPPPTSLSDLQHASLEQKAMMSLHPTTLRIEEAMPTSDPEPVETPWQMHMRQQEENGAMDMEMEASDDEEDERQKEQTRKRQAQEAAKAGPGQGQMKIRSDYVPRALAKRQQGSMGICPNCKQSIALDEMEEHMRIELLDPRWKEQRARADSKQATTNLSTNDTVMNLKRLASQRDDLFDSNSGRPVSAEELERRKRVATGGWDGSAETKEAARMQQLQNVNVQEQIDAIRRKAGAVSNPGVGPQRQ